MREGDGLRELRFEFDQLSKRMASFEARLKALEDAEPEEDILAPAPPPPDKPIIMPPRSFSAAPMEKRVLLSPPSTAEAGAAPESPEPPSESEKPVPARVAPAVQERTGPGLGDQMAVWIRKLGPKEELSWEMALGTYWLPRVGMLIVAVGVVLLAALAIQRLQDKWWLPHLRVAMGYAIAGALIGVGRWLETRFSEYARILMAGGLALVYFVTFATYYIPFTRVFHSPAPTFVLLTLVVAVWFLLAQLRGSRLVAAGMTVLGHLTIFLSTVTLHTPSRMAPLGLILLGVVSALFLVRNRWYHVAALGMAGSYFNYALWLMKTPGTGQMRDFFAVMGLLAIYFLTFAGAEALAPEGLRRRALSPRFRNLYVSCNSAAAFSLGVLLMRHYPFTRGHTYLFYFGFAAILFGLGQYYLRRLKNDQVYNIYFVKACAALTLGLAVYFDGAVLTLALAVQSVTLLASARRSGLVVTRALSLSVTALALFHGFFSAAGAPIAYSADGYISALIPAFLTLVSLLGAGVLYDRTDWSSRTLTRKQLPAVLHGVFWQLDLLTEPPPHLTGFPSKQVVPRLYAWGAAVLAVTYSMQLAAGIHSGAALTIAALLFLVAALAAGIRPFTEASLILTVAGAVLWHGFALAPAFKSGAAPEGWNVFLVPLFLLSALFAFGELTRLFAGSRAVRWTVLGAKHVPQDLCRLTGLESPRHVSLLPLLYGALFAEMGWITALWACSKDNQTLAVAFAALFTGVYAGFLRAPGIGLASMLLAVFTGGTAVVDFSTPLAWSTAIPVVLLLFATAVTSEVRYVGRRNGLALSQTQAGAYLLYAMAALALGVHLLYALDSPYDVHALAVAGVLAAALTYPFNARALGYCAVGFLLVSAFDWADQDPGWELAQWNVEAIALAALLLVIERFFAWRRIYENRAAQYILIALAWLVPLWQTVHLENSDWVYAEAAAISLFFLGYGGLFRVSFAAVLAMLSAGAAAILLLAVSYVETVALFPLVAGYAGAILFWGLCERGAVLLRKRGIGLPAFFDVPELEPVLVFVPSVLLMVMLERIPLLSEYYLTISWAIAAVSMLGISFVLRQKFYRYAGLLAFVPAILRVALWDTRRLEGGHRIAAWLALGSILLAVSYGYVHARAYIAKQRRAAAGEQDEA